MTVLCVLPARIGSQRIPHKPLQRIAGRSLVEWSWIAASAVPGIDRVVIATDSEEIVSTATAFGAEVCLTSMGHESGTDRVAEVVRGEWGKGAAVVVNFQADEPFLPPAAVQAAVDAVKQGAEVATLACPIRDEEEWMSPAVVKVARAANGRALYFSRAAVPHPRDVAPRFGDATGPWLRHIGLYVYSPEALERWVKLPVSPLEVVERLEQLRALEGGIGIHVCVVDTPEGGVDVPQDLERAERLLSNGNDHMHGIQEAHV
jgi:3-deoxy-manno-octulosonate cytidylyltransferase (CMP-KDO synthetase)